MEERTKAAIITVLIKRDGETKRYRTSGQNSIVETTDLLTGETKVVLCGDLNLHEVEDEREVRGIPTREELKRAMRERAMQPAPVFIRTDASVPGAWSGDYRSDKTSLTRRPLLRPEDLKADPDAEAFCTAITGWKKKTRGEIANVLPDPHYMPVMAPADIQDLDIRSSHRPKRAVRYVVRDKNS